MKRFILLAAACVAAYSFFAVYNAENEDGRAAATPAPPENLFPAGLSSTTPNLGELHESSTYAPQFKDAVEFGHTYLGSNIRQFVGIFGVEDGAEAKPRLLAVVNRERDPATGLYADASYRLSSPHDIISYATRHYNDFLLVLDSSAGGAIDVERWVLRSPKGAWHSTLATAALGGGVATPISEEHIVGGEWITPTKRSTPLNRRTVLRTRLQTIVPSGSVVDSFVDPDGRYFLVYFSDRIVQFSLTVPDAPQTWEVLATDLPVSIDQLNGVYAFDSTASERVIYAEGRDLDLALIDVANDGVFDQINSATRQIFPPPDGPQIIDTMRRIYW